MLNCAALHCTEAPESHLVSLESGKEHDVNGHEALPWLREDDMQRNDMKCKVQSSSRWQRDHSGGGTESKDQEQKRERNRKNAWHQVGQVVSR